MVKRGLEGGRAYARKASGRPVLSLPAVAAQDIQIEILGYDMERWLLAIVNCKQFL